jgi:hypothetical protein
MMRRSGEWGITACVSTAWFAHDSALEESGFEPSVPLGEKRSFRNASIRELHRAAYLGGRNDIGADDRQAAGDQIIATRLRRRNCR